mmetsp:Transcript_12851/g.46982  ORF Transcript_12851/g.46982 Transcript_12851/m.46982 type:complete len:252 (-) Transcript_12851:27-782(-)
MQPLLPSVTTTTHPYVCASASLTAVACAAHSTSLHSPTASGCLPPTARASCSLSMSKSVSRSTGGGTSQAGATLRSIKFLKPSLRSSVCQPFTSFIARKFSSKGTSICKTHRSPFPRSAPSVSQSSKYLAELCRFAPPPTTIWFSPWASTKMAAQAVRAVSGGSFCTCLRQTPAFLSPRRAQSFRASWPTQPIKVTSTPNAPFSYVVAVKVCVTVLPSMVSVRVSVLLLVNDSAFAAAAAWLAPFPPGSMS